MKRIKYIAQIQQTECGLCVIAMMLNYYGAHYSLYDLRRFVEIGRDGMSVADILHMFEKFGLHVDAFKCQDVQKLRNLNAPFIITMEKNHMVIVEKVTKHNIYIVDSAFGKLKYSYEEFVRSFDGICIEVVPGEKFCKKKREHKMFKILFPLMKEKKWKYVLFMCFSFFNYFLLMLLLTYMQKFVDSIYENGNSLIYIYYILLLIIMYIISTLFMKFYMGDLKIVIDKKINLKLINHLLNLPYIFLIQEKKQIFCLH